MIKIKKISYSIVWFSLNVSFALADTTSNGQIGNPIKAKSITDFFLSLTKVCIQIGTVVAGLAIIYGGLMFVTAQGDEEKIGKARNTMTWALVGTAILLGANVIVTAIQGTINTL